MRKLIIAIMAIAVLLMSWPTGVIAATAYDITEQTYREHDIAITYPRITGLKDKNVQAVANALIAADALRILQDYTAAERRALTLNLQYAIKLQSSEILSIVYTGDRYLAGTMYPVRVFFTTNINLRDGTRLQLCDLFTIDSKFVGKLKNGRLQTISPELTLAQLDLADDRLLQAFLLADAPQEQNLENVYSYFTSDGIGISLGVSHAMGDYVLFAADYPDIAPFMLAGSQTLIAGLRPDACMQVRELSPLAAYFPSAPGRVWVYEGEGMEYAAFTRRVMFQQDNRVQIVDDNGGSRVIRGFAIDAAGIRQIFTLPETDSEENWLSMPEKESSLLLKAPLTAGAVWQDELYRREIISVNETVTTPAGVFSNIVKVKITGLAPEQDWRMYEYYAAGFGLVMREFITVDNHIVSSKLKTIIR